MLMLIFILHISFFVIFANFNTSHVNVNPLEEYYGSLMLIPYNHRTEIENIYFNTSHVNVNLKSHKG